MVKGLLGRSVLKPEQPWASWEGVVLLPETPRGRGPWRVVGTGQGSAHVQGCSLLPPRLPQGLPSPSC